MKTILAVLLFLAVSAYGQNQSAPISPETQKAIERAEKACKQSTIDMIHVWNEQLIEDANVVEKLSYQELDDRESTIRDCLLVISGSEARRNQKGTEEESNPRVLAYLADGYTLLYAYEQEQKLRLLRFIEARGLKKAFVDGSNATSN